MKAEDVKVGMVVKSRGRYVKLLARIGSGDMYWASTFVGATTKSGDTLAVSASHLRPLTEREKGR